MSSGTKKSGYLFLLHSFYCVIFSLGLIAANGQSVQPKFVHLNGSRAYTDIKTILPDSKNFLWFGCNQGLVRFNGSNYIRYAPGSGTKTISSANITTLYEDDKENIWIGTADKGLFRYSYTTDDFIQIKNTEGFSVSSVQSFGNSLLVTANKQVFVFAAEKNDLNPLQGTEQLKKNNITVVKSLADNAAKELVWLLCSDGLYKCKDGVLSKAHNYPYSVDELGNALKTLSISGDGKIYTATKNIGLVEFSAEKNSTTVYPFSKKDDKAYSNNNADALIWLEDNQLLVATKEAGLAVFNTAQKKFSFFNQDNFPESDIFNFQATAFGSNKTHIAFATQNKGIWVYNIAQTSRFSSVPVTSIHNKVPGTLYTRSILAVPETNNVYVGSFYGDGLYEYNTASGKVNSFPFVRNILAAKTLIINHIYKDKSGVIWLASHGNGLLIFDAGRQTIILASEKFPALSSVTNKKIYCVYEDKNESLYIGTGGEGIMVVNKLRNEVKKYTHNKSNPTSILNDSIFAERFFEDQAGNIWISTIRGISVFQPSVNRFYNFTTEPGKVNSIPKAFWYAVEQDNAGNIFIGTNDGLYKIRAGEKNLVNAGHYSEKEGLSHNNIYSMIKDKQGLLWITCRNGISCFNPVDETFRNFTYKNGLPAKTLMSPMSLSANGNIYHGSVENFFSFNTTALLQKLQKPQVWFTGLKIFDKDTLSGLELNKTEKIKLQYAQHSFSFSFTSPALLYPEEISYTYMLEGVDKDWIVAANRNYAAYTNIKPGTYVFKVKTANADGNFYGEVRSIAIVITAPFWQRWWFILLCGLAALLGGYAIIKQREKTIKKKEAEKTEIEKIKAGNYQYQLEIEKVIGFFGATIHQHDNADELLWDVSKNLIGKLGFEDCMIYMWNEDKTVLLQKAGYGIKGSMQIEINKNIYHVPKGKGIVGATVESGHYLLVNDTSLDSRYFSADGKIMLSELCVPISHNNEAIGAINTEHSEKNFYTDRHLQILTTIASMLADKIDMIGTQQHSREKEMEVLKLNKDLATSQLTTLRAQMNPHFIFNALNSVQQYILQGNITEANRYLSKFSKLQREVLNHSDQNFISLEKELEVLSLYLELEQLRFDGSFIYEIKMDAAIDTDEIKIPPMIVQPFIENSIWHGLMPKQGERWVHIHFSLSSEDLLICTVTDNGIGRQAAARLKQNGHTQHKSKGLSLVYDRLNILRQQYDQAFDVSIKDIVDNNNLPAGTEVKLHIYTG